MQPTKNIRFTFLILILMASLSACTSGSSNSSGAPAGGPQGTDGTNPGIPSTDANGNSTGQPTRPARPTTCTLPQPPAQNMNDFVVMAIHFADTACLKVAVNSGFNVNTKVKDLGESKARYPLLRALDASDLAFAGLNGNKTDVVEFLISNGADPAVLNDLGQNALQILFDASSGKLAENLDVLNLFIDLKKFDLNEKGPQRDTYLVRAINEKLLDLAKRLIANGADINLSTGSTTPLFAAIDNRLTPLAEFIIDQGADLSLTDFASQTALTIAIRANQENLAIKIANKMTAAQLNKLDMIQKSSVIWAIQAHMVKLVPTLIVNGADVNLSPTDTNCLIESVRSRNSIIYNAVVRQMKNLNSAGENGETALMFAATFGDASTVSDLIKRGAKIEIHDQTGNSALTMASTADATEALVVSGANVNLLTSSGESALSIAISRGRIDQARVLLTHGADILWRDHSGNGLLFKNDSVSARFTCHGIPS